jgi:thiol-disulfide isomerase/thioredoxin
MDYYNKILILNKYFKHHADKQDIKSAESILANIKSLHGKIIEYILMLRDSSEENKLEVLSDLERINYKIILIIDNCENNISKINEEEILNKEEIIDIKKVDVKKKLDKKLPSLILFHAEWCGHCKTLIPIWDAVAKLIPSEKLNVLKVSCVEKEKECSNIKEVKGYPTIMFVNLKENNIVTYSGERTPESIIKFINDSTGENIIKNIN